MNYLRPERLDALAREYATGQLAGRARRRFERLLREQPQAARAVAAWQERLAVLAGGVPPMEPREAVWAGLERRLFAPAPAAPARSSGWQVWWQGLWSGRSLGGALAGALLCVLVLRLQPGWVGLEPAADGLPASYVGLLFDGAGKPTVLASSRRHGRQLSVKLLQPLAVPPGRVAQLWALPRGGGAALPVGVVPLVDLKPGSSVTVALPGTSEALFFKVDRLAISLEAAPAAAGSAPTAEFVVSGHCVKLW